MERRFVSVGCAPVEVREAEGEPTIITGYAAVFYREGAAGTEYQLWPGTVERISRDAFAGVLERGDDARGLFNHDPDNLLGRVGSGTARISADDVGLRYEIDIDPNDPDHSRVLAKIRRGDLTGSSFSFTVERQEWHDMGEESIRVITSFGSLIDFGPVTFPAYEATEAAARAVGETEEARQAHDAWAGAKDAEAVAWRAEAVGALSKVQDAAITP
jgi:HK97 family phage prohead protease